MTTTPFTLSDLVSNEILQPLERLVKTLPANMPCVVDPSHEMRAFHGSRGGIWAKCDVCGFLGDGIDLFKVAMDEPDTRRAIREMNRRNLLIDPDRRGLSDILQYEQQQTVQRDLRVIVQAGKERLIGSPAIAEELSLDQKFMFGAEHGWPYAMADLFAVVPRAELLMAMPPGHRPRIKTGGYFLVLPYYDVPGHLSVLRAFYRYGSELKYHDFPGVPGRLGCGGFALWQNTDKKTVFASDDYELVGKIHVLDQLSVSASRVPIIAYHEKTVPECWRNVMARNRILIDNPLTVNALVQCRAVPSSLVSVEPPPTMPNVFAVDSANWMSIVRRQALPILPATKRKLGTLSDEEALAFLPDLNLTAEEQAYLLQSSDEQKRHVLELIFVDLSKVKERLYDGRRILETNRSWFIDVHGRQVKISDSVVRISHVINIEDKPYISGLIEQTGRSAPFCCELETMRKGTDWMTSAAMRHNFMPEVHPKWHRKIFDLARLFTMGNPIIEHRDSRIGWAKDFNSFSFLDMTVRQGEPDLADPGVPTLEKGPFKPVVDELPTQLLLDSSEPTEVNVSFWAFVGLLGASIVAPVLGIGRRNIGLLGNFSYAQMLAEVLGLVRRKIAKVAVDDYVHDLPVFIDEPVTASNFEVFREKAGTWPTNSLASLTRFGALSLRGQQWSFVQSVVPGTPVRQFERAVQLLPSIIRLVYEVKLSSDFRLLPSDILEALRCRLRRQIPDLELVAVDLAASYIQFDSPFGTLTDDRWFVEILKAATIEGRLSIMEERGRGVAVLYLTDQGGRIDPQWIDQLCPTDRTLRERLLKAKVLVEEDGQYLVPPDVLSLL